MGSRTGVSAGVAVMGVLLGLIVGAAAVGVSSGQLIGGRAGISTQTETQTVTTTLTIPQFSTATSTVTVAGAKSFSSDSTISVSATSGASVMHLQASQLLYSGGSTITVFGAVNPAPALSTGVVVTTTNPKGLVVDVGEALLGSTTGTFLYSLPSGGSANWIAGAYSVNASSDSGSATTVFYYNPLPSGASSTALTLQVLTPAVASAGDQAYVALLLTLPNGVVDDAVSWSILAVLFPDGTLHNLCTTADVSSGCTGTLSRIHAGFYQVTFTLPTTAEHGTYFVEAAASDSSGKSARALGQFSVP